MFQQKFWKLESKWMIRIGVNRMMIAVSKVSAGGDTTEKGQLTFRTENGIGLGGSRPCGKFA